MRTEVLQLYSPPFSLSLTGKNMGEFSLNLLLTVKLEVGIFQNFVLATVVTEETARTTAIAHSKHTFATKLLPC